MKPTIDIHCHSLASGHSYNTVDELAAAAKNQNLELIALTDHTPGMPGGPHIFHFYNLRVLPQYIEGVRILKGAEANILPDGTVDLKDDLLSELELVIASLHIPCIKPSDKSTHTALLKNVMANTYVSIIGHPGDTRYDFDIPEIVRTAKETGTLLEINNNSLKPGCFREGGDTMIIEILKECERQGAMVVCGSDAHYRDAVGMFEESLEVFERLKFPKELVVSDMVKLLDVLERKRMKSS